MTAQPNMVDPQGGDEATDARIVARKPTRGSVLVQNSRGDRCIALLRDISTYGCNLLTEAEWMRPGNYITIRLGSERTIQAIVRWTRDGAKGVEFLRPIPDADAERIARVTN